MVASRFGAIEGLLSAHLPPRPRPRRSRPSRSANAHPHPPAGRRRSTGQVPRHHRWFEATPLEMSALPAHWPASGRRRASTTSMCRCICWPAMTWPGTTWSTPTTRRCRRNTSAFFSRGAMTGSAWRSASCWSDHSWRKRDSGGRDARPPLARHRAVRRKRELDEASFREGLRQRGLEEWLEGYLAETRR